MANIRVMPPADGNHPSITVGGNRVYTCALGATIDVPDFDARILLANDWIPSALGGVGSTANRTVHPKTGDNFLDTTVGHVIVWDGLTWRDPIDGTAA